MHPVQSFSTTASGWVVLVHGGAGLRSPDPAAAEAGCRAAADAAAELLERGGAALDAVQCAVERLEADPQFNAGTGGSLTESGELELDASLMDGQSARFGAVCALPPFEHPIAIARAVLEEGRHVLYAAQGAAEFALQRGFEPAAPGRMITEAARRRLERARRSGSPGGMTGTVGAVALCARGTLAAATSTGGTSGKRRGRVGDSPIPGAGTFASELGAASATGHGEGILRVGLTREVLERLRAGHSAEQAVSRAVAEMRSKVGSLGGVILVTADHKLAWARSTEAMTWAAAWQGGGSAAGS